MNITMKATKVILTLSIVLISAFSFAGKPPVQVKKAFEKKFPGLKSVKWIKESPTKWEVVFHVNGIRSHADFNAEGTWLETETVIKVSELPSSALNALMEHSSGWTVTEVDKVETHNHEILFVVDMKKPMLKTVLAFKEDGTRVQ